MEVKMDQFSAINWGELILDRELNFFCTIELVVGCCWWLPRFRRTSHGWPPYYLPGSLYGVHSFSLPEVWKLTMEKNWWLIAGSGKMMSFLNDILEKPRTLLYLRYMIIIDYYDDIPETTNRRYFQGLIRSPSWHHGRHHAGASLFSWKQSSREQPEVRPLPRAKDVGCRYFFGTMIWNYWFRVDILQSRVKVVAILCFWVHTIGRSFSGGS